MGRKADKSYLQFFEDGKDNKKKCTICKTELNGNYPYNLRRHLSNLHPVENKILINNNEDQEPMTPEDIKKACVGFVITENLPFTFFDSEHFKLITKQLFDGFEMPEISSDNIMEYVTEVYVKEKNNLKEILKNKLVSLKIDIATRLNRSIMVVNVQFYNDTKIITKTLGCIELKERHSAEYLESKVKELLKSFHIQKSQIYSITIDIGRNLVNMLTIFGEEIENKFNDDNNWNVLEKISIFSMKPVRCSTYYLLLAVKDYFDTIDKNLFQRVRESYKASQSATSSHSNTIDQYFPQVSMDKHTTSNSTIKMERSIMPSKESYETDFDVDFNLRQSNRKNEEALLSLLEPVNNAIKRLQGHEIFLSDFFKIWLEMKQEIKKKSNNTELLSKLKQQEEILLEDTIMLSALYLDPRLQCNIMNDPLKIMSARTHLKEVIERMLTLNKQIGKSSEALHDIILSQSDMQPSTSRDAASQEPSQASYSGQYLNSFTVYREKADFAEIADDESLQNAYLEIDSFNPTPYSLEKSLFECWENEKRSYPYLYSLARVIQCVPATHASVERASTALKLVLNDLRLNISAEDLEKIMFVKLNI